MAPGGDGGGLAMLLKLGLVAASVGLATLAARRFGHGVAGVLSGLPMISGPIMAFVVLEQPVEQARAIALATLVCLPATVLHMLVFARTARTRPWWLAFAAANLAFVLGGWGLSRLALPQAAVGLLAVAAPLAGVALLRAGAGAARAVAIPRGELLLRIAAAVALAAVILLGAATLPPLLSGLLLALPIAGNVLPCFTLPRHGVEATATLLAGFLRGLFGFAAAFAVLHAALGSQGPAVALLMALAAALLAATAVDRLRRRGAI